MVGIQQRFRRIDKRSGGTIFIKMIIAFDGNVFSGKTSLIEKLHGLGKSGVIPEHSYFLENVSSEEDAWSVQKKYINTEGKRHEYLSHLSAGSLILLDRSFVSMAAHVSALWTMRGIDIRSHFLHEIVSRIHSNNVIVPDKFCFVMCDYKIIRRRALKDTSKNTDRFYYAQNYLEAIDAFNRRWQEHFQGIVIDTSTDDSVQSGKQAAIQQLADPASLGYNVNDICRCLDEMLT
jgi:deoxyadenosine/deoxycytidine kinase